MPARRLLVATDFSDASRRAFDAACLLGSDLGAELVLLHVLAEHAVPRPTRDEEEVRTLSVWAQEARGRGLSVATETATSAAPDVAIVETAQRLGCALVALGITGRGGLERFLVGSTARGVLQRSRMPVLAVPARFGPATGGRPTGARPGPLLVAVDFSPSSDAAVAAAAPMARDLESALRLVHVVDIPFTSAAVPYSAAVVSPAMLQRDEEDAAGRLASLASQLSGAPGRIPVDVEVQVGHPSSAILASARSCGASLIVVGTHGKGAVRRFFLGSVAQQLVQMADRPVLVVPERMAP